MKVDIQESDMIEVRKGKYTPGFDLKARICEKFRFIFKAAIATGHDTVIINDFNCRFGLPPDNCASFFYEILEEETFKGLLRSVVFCVSGNATSEGFLSVFQKEVDWAASAKSGK